MYVIQQLIESFDFALSALRQNLLRTTLSLLGVTIGIFAIITVFTAVDSLERNLKQSLSILGDNVIYVEKWPWAFDNPNYPWWNYWKRPSCSYDEYVYLEKNLKNKDGIAIFRTKGNLLIKYANNSIEGGALQGVTYGFQDISEITLNDGRYFTEHEVVSGRNVVILGADIADALFPNTTPLGKEVKVKGHKFKVIGTTQKVGNSSIQIGPSADMNCLVPYKAFNKIYAKAPSGPEARIGIKGLDNDKNMENLEGELNGLMRQLRSLKPTEVDDFAMNRPEMLTGIITNIFDAISTAGWIIGMFSILVGGFGIANIMFVSVKERTNIIGIQKSLGAKNYFILGEFLFESVLLSLIGGVVGLILVAAIVSIPQDALTLYFSYQNALVGLLISTIIGLLSGILPAISASRMDPVIAMRSK